MKKLVEKIKIDREINKFLRELIILEDSHCHFTGVYKRLGDSIFRVENDEMHIYYDDFEICSNIKYNSYVHDEFCKFIKSIYCYEINEIIIWDYCDSKLFERDLEYINKKNNYERIIT